MSKVYRLQCRKKDSEVGFWFEFKSKKKLREKMEILMLGPIKYDMKVVVLY